MNYKYSTVFVIIMLAVALLIATGCKKNGNDYTQKDVAEFAKCLTDKGAVMYGAFWCPHCANVKKKFGSAFQFITYVECDPRGENSKSDLCIKKGIQNYATFEFSDGSRLVGEPTWEEMGVKTGCLVPGGEQLSS